jgi:hypothetical protein
LDAFSRPELSPDDELVGRPKGRIRRQARALRCGR